MPGFSAVARSRAPPSIQAGSSSFTSSARLLEEAYIQSAARTRPRTEAPPATPGSALRCAKTPNTSWGSKRQTFAMDGIVETAQQIRSSSRGRSIRSRQGDSAAARAVQQAAGATFSSIGGEFGTADAHYEVSAGQPAMGDAGVSFDDEGTMLSSPTRQPGLAGQLARAQALLADATAEQSRLEAELAYERENAEAAQQQAQAELEAERVRYRREVEFVRAGVDAAAEQRDKAAAKRKEAHEKALKRAVREAEERAAAEAEQAAMQTDEAHNAQLEDMQRRYEEQLDTLRCARPLETLR